MSLIVRMRALLIQQHPEIERKRIHLDIFPRQARYRYFLEIARRSNHIIRSTLGTYADGHVEIRYIRNPTAVGRSFFIKNNFEDGQVAVLDILLKHAAQVAAGLPVDIIHDVIIIYRLVEELLVEATKDAAPAPIVVDNGAYHVVQHAAFVEI